MIHKAFTILDTKTGIYNAPFFVHLAAHAIRAICDLCNAGDSTPARYPHDFMLFEIGEYDDNTGLLSSREYMNYGSIASIHAQSRVER